MIVSLSGACSILQWGWAGTALEDESGDLHVIAPFAGGVLVGLLDGLGHGAEAAAAASAAVPILEAHAAESVIALVQRCHEGLRSTRGIVMSLASFDSRASSMTWTGVGNVDGFLFRADDTAAPRACEAIASRGGVVGYRLPQLHANTLRVAPGDTLVLATDGIRSGFTTGLATAPAPQEIAEYVIARFAKGSDDAHVVVARYLGPDP